MIKYELIPEQLIREGSIQESQLVTPSIMEESSILRVHQSEYWKRLLAGELDRNEQRRTGFPWSPELVERERVIMQGTLDASRSALKHGAALNIAGGTHHAYRHRGEGFCLLNDIALAAAGLLDEGLIRRALVVDLDVHQGNGTASIFQEDDRVFTFSMHGAHNYPMHKEQSDLDVALPDGISDDAYLDLLRRHLPVLIDQVQPDILFYQCGVDILNTDKLGRLNISLEGCRERDRIVLAHAYNNGIPICASMGGGYSEDIRMIVDAHCNTFREVMNLWG